MRTADLDYVLPDELIARHPTAARDGARLLVVEGDAVDHRRIVDLPALLVPGDLLVVNDSRVLRARLRGTRETGGRVEVFLLRRLAGGPAQQRWSALGRASKPLRPGTTIAVHGLTVTVVDRTEGLLTVELSAAGAPVDPVLERVGEVPLPPYLGREPEPDDVNRYQTVFARRPGSVAAPTAGLHLTEPLLQRLAERGVERAAVTLHVGLGTFRPVVADDLADHRMHEEWFEVGSDLVAAVERTRSRGGRVVAVGTTVVRALESAVDAAGRLTPGADATTLMIQPGHRFTVVDALLTNFHQPRSTLLALVAAFVGLGPLKAAYATAVAERYRFLSYGDAMFLPRRLP